MVVEFLGDAGVDELGERGQIARGLVTEPAPDHHGLEVDVEPRGDQRLVAAGHHHQLVDELVVGAAPAAHLLAQRAFLGLCHLLDDQHLEVKLFAPVDRLLFQRARIGGEHVGVVEPRGVHVAGPV